MKKGRIKTINQEGCRVSYKPQYYQFFFWWDFIYQNTVGGCDLGTASKVYNSYEGAFDLLLREGCDITDEKEQKILEIQKNIVRLEEELVSEKKLLKEICCGT